MQVKLKNGEIDVCIGTPRAVPMRGKYMADSAALTDALIAGLANGQTSYKLVGRYIASSLRWYVCELVTSGRSLMFRAIITGKDSRYNSVDDLKGTTFGISRLGR